MERFRRIELQIMKEPLYHFSNYLEGAGIITMVNYIIC